MRSVLRTGRTKPGSNCIGDCRTLNWMIWGKKVYLSFERKTNTVAQKSFVVVLISNLNVMYSVPVNS